MQALHHKDIHRMHTALNLKTSGSYSTIFLKNPELRRFGAFSFFLVFAGGTTHCLTPGITTV